MAQLMEGKSLAEKIKAEVKAEVDNLKKTVGLEPRLVGVLVGENKASEIYLRTKEKTALALGISSQILRLPGTLSQKELLGHIGAFNQDESVDGILVQLPLPPGFRASEVIEAISPAKDVDGFHPINLGRILMNEPSLRPCTPAGIIELLKHYRIALEGKEVVVIGRSLIVGKPLAAMLTNENCTVTLCHSRTRDLSTVASRADILVAAMGRPGLVTPEFIKVGATVVDVGINYLSDPALVTSLFGHDERRSRDLEEKGYTIVGDVHPRAKEKAAMITPVPGGVGPLTVAMLMRNTLLAFKSHHGLS